MCSLLTLLFVAKSPGGSLGMMRSALLGLVGLLAFGHLANILEANGMQWADTIADQFSTGGAIQLALTVEADEAVLSVHASGVGIPASTCAKLFTPFFTTKGAQGSGLGLNVVKTVVEEHQGQIAVESEPQRGTTFSLRLPLLHSPRRAGAELR